MSDKKTQVDCRLITNGTERANAKVIKDLNVSDPEPVVGKQIIKDAMGEGSEDDSKTENS